MASTYYSGTPTITILRFIIRNYVGRELWFFYVTYYPLPPPPPSPNILLLATGKDKTFPMQIHRS